MFNLPKKNTKIGYNTIELMKVRRKLDKTTQQYKALNKTIKKEIRKDTRAFKTNLIKECIEDNANMRVLKSKLAVGRAKLVKMKNNQGIVVSDKKDVVEIIENFYRTLYTASPVYKEHSPTKNILNVGSEDIPEITIAEIRAALKQMKNRKSPGEDRITSEMLKLGGKIVEQATQILLNKCLKEEKIPDDWINAEVIILFKKGDISNIENYRPISLLSQMYKLFTRIIANRLTNKLDSYQPVEQAGFRKGYSTVEHLQTLRLLIEKATEYDIPLHLAFVDFQKAFDCIETHAFLKAMDRARIDSRYTNIIKNIYQNATFHVKIDEELQTNKIKIQRGVRQGDPISPKLFTLALEDVFKELAWEKKGIRIDGSYLNNLRFADDIVLISSDVSELGEMLEQLNNAAKSWD